MYLDHANRWYSATIALLRSIFLVQRKHHLATIRERVDWRYCVLYNFTLGFILHFTFFGLGELFSVSLGLVYVCWILVQAYNDFLRLGQRDSFVCIAYMLCFATWFVSIRLVDETNLTQRHFNVTTIKV